MWEVVLVVPTVSSWCWFSSLSDSGFILSYGLSPYLPKDLMFSVTKKVLWDEYAYLGRLHSGLVDLKGCLERVSSATPLYVDFQWTVEGLLEMLGS